MVFFAGAVIGLMVACVATYGAGDDREDMRSLVIDPDDFLPVSFDAFRPAFIIEGQRYGLSSGEFESDDDTERGFAPQSSGAVDELVPRIVLRRPEDASVFREGESVTVFVEFLPAYDGVVPVMGTLKVRVRKGWFGRDITDQVAPYIEGFALHVPEVDFSGHTGEFVFEIRILDRRGRMGVARFRLTVLG